MKIVAPTGHESEGDSAKLSARRRGAEEFAVASDWSPDTFADVSAAGYPYSVECIGTNRLGEDYAMPPLFRPSLAVYPGIPDLGIIKITHTKYQMLNKPDPMPAYEAVQRQILIVLRHERRYSDTSSQRG